MKPLKFAHRLLLLGFGFALLAACAAPATPTSAPAGATTAPAGSVKLTLAAYSTPAEAYAKIIPLFQAGYKAKTGQDVTFATSYQGSGAQARAVAGGLEADVVALSLGPDVDTIAKAKLITHDWTTAPHTGIVSDSVVAFAVRKGNPKGIKDWADLAQTGLNVLTPDAATSGGARWNILGLYGAALRGQVTGVTANDQKGAQDFLTSVLKNVSVMDKDARTSITTFEKGIGDVAITYEDEVLLGQQRGQDYALVIPHSTILIETPVAVVDSYVDKHGTRAVAEAFVNFLFTAPAQQVFAQFGFRPVDAGVAQSTATEFPAVADPFTVDQFGGWSKASADVFTQDTGVYYQSIATAQGK
jgi:sulfate/thiosulfate transport system substrate-binding protein